MKVADCKFRITGTGCSLVDYLYQPVSFSGEAFKKYLSLAPGDGGLSPGKLVFAEELERFSRRPYPDLRDENGNYFPSDKDFFVEAEKGRFHILQKVCGIDKEILRRFKNVIQ